MRQDVSCKQGTAPHMGNIRKHMCDGTLLIKPELMDPVFTYSGDVLLDFLHFICLPYNISLFHLLLEPCLNVGLGLKWCSLERRKTNLILVLETLQMYIGMLLYM